MPIRKARAVWNGGLKDGKGEVSASSGNLRLPYSAGSRFSDQSGTNPEELIGAAHAGCFSMALANDLAEAGHAPEKISTEAAVSLEKDDDGFTIESIELTTEAVIPDIEDDVFAKLAEKAKDSCPVSRALAGTDIKLNARLTTPA